METTKKALFIQLYRIGLFCVQPFLFRYTQYYRLSYKRMYEYGTPITNTKLYFVVAPLGEPSPMVLALSDILSS